MDWAEALLAALEPVGIPCGQNTYEGDEKTYIVFNAAIIPSDYADDEPQHERVLIQVHLFAPATRNTTALRKGIKLAMQGAGFTYPDETDVSNEKITYWSPESSQHVVFESQWVQGV